MCTLRCLLRRSLEIPSTPLALALLGNQLQAKVLTMDEARRIASNIAQAADAATAQRVEGMRTGKERYPWSYPGRAMPSEGMTKNLAPSTGPA